MLGALVGAIGALVARGEARATLLDLRQWSARELRKLEHRPQSAAPSSPAVVASASAPVGTTTLQGDCLQVSRPAPDDPCAALLAPFAAARTEVALATSKVPHVRVEDLPRVQPPAVAHRHHVRHAPAVTTEAPPDADADAEDPATPSPRPTWPIPDDDTRRPRGTSMEQTAENDARW